MNNVEVYIQVDEIDHVTHAYNQGKGLDVPHAVKLIRRWAVENEKVAALTKDMNPIFAPIEDLPVEKLVETLVAIREILLKQVF